MHASHIAAVTLAAALATACAKDRPGESHASGDDASAAEASRPAPTAVAGWDVLGDGVTAAAPVPGRFAGSYDYAQSSYPTRERYISHTIAGAAVLELSDDGSASGCFGKRARHTSSVSRHASHDGEHHRDEREDDRLVGARGTWKRDGNAARVSFDRIQHGSCEITEPSGSTVELRCLRLHRRDGKPAAVMACAMTPWLGFDDLAINPAGSPRARPYTLQTDPSGLTQRDPGTPWLVLGDAPGLSMRSRDERGSQPGIELVEQQARFNEAAYRPRAP